jgi:hypothetical protein
MQNGTLKGLAVPLVLASAPLQKSVANDWDLFGHTPLTVVAKPPNGARGGLGLIAGDRSLALAAQPPRSRRSR